MSQLIDKAKKEYDLGHYMEALSLYNLLIKEESNNPYLHYEKSLCLIKLNKFSEAESSLEKALSLQPENPFRHASLAYIKSRVGKIEEAIKLYEQAIKIDPEDVISMNNLGLLEEQSGRRSKAKKYFHDVDLKIKREQQTPSTNTITRKEENSCFNIIKKVFTEKSMFKEFIRFLFGKNINSN